MKSLAEAMRAKLETDREIQQLREETEARIADLKRHRSWITETIEQFRAGIDVARVMHAESILNIEGHYSGNGDQPEALQAAVEDITSGCGDLIKMYRGTKNYGTFRCQRCDLQYGFGPKHGTVTFSIGLRASHRHLLSDNQVEDCLYYLLNLEKIQSIQDATVPAT